MKFFCWLVAIWLALLGMVGLAFAEEKAVMATCKQDLPPSVVEQAFRDGALVVEYQLRETKVDGVSCFMTEAVYPVERKKTVRVSIVFNILGDDSNKTLGEVSFVENSGKEPLKELTEMYKKYKKGELKEAAMYYAPSERTNFCWTKRVIFPQD